MTDTGAGALRTPGAGTRSTAYTGSTDRTTAWTGWVAFAAIISMMLGAFQIIMGLVAIFDDDFFVVTESGMVVALDYTAWGWLHLIIGALMVLIGIGLMSGNTFARVGGIVLAVISAVVNLAFIASYPLWSIIIITLDVLVIYAIAVHGREMRNI